ncbi:Glutathione S-transferase GstA [compost metagenome]
MKLYFSPGACALASQIALREAGMNFDLVKVNLKDKQYEGGDYKQINPKGYVPALQMKDGEILTESGVILQWIADQVPEKNLIPKFGTPERYRAMEWLNYIATELHKTFGSLFYPQYLTEEAMTATHDKLQKRLDLLNQHIEQKEYIVGSHFTVVDAYAYNILRWSRMLKVDLSNHKNLLAFVERINTRPTVQAAVEAEGLRLS